MRSAMATCEYTGSTRIGAISASNDLSGWRPPSSTLMLLRGRYLYTLCRCRATSHGMHCTCKSFAPECT